MLLPVCLLLAGGLQAQSCYPWTTVGRYLVLCDGYMSPAANAPMVPAKGLGIATADENGTFTATDTLTVGGTVLTQELTGTEKLNLDCTGTITYKQTVAGQPGPPLNITFIVSEQGARIDGLITDPGAVLACVLRRVPTVQQGASTPAAKKEEAQLASRSTNSTGVSQPTPK